MAPNAHKNDHMSDIVMPEKGRSPKHQGGHGHSSGDYATPNAGPLALIFCFFGIMGSFIMYGIVMEYATSGGRHLHELSMIFITSTLYSITAVIGRSLTAETPTTVPKEKLLVLALTSMGSTFTSVRSLRYVIYPIQVLAKSCKPVPVMLMGAVMGKKYPLKKYVNVCVIVTGVALFMQKGGGGGGDADQGGANQLFGVLLLFISLCFDGGTGAYEDKLMGKEHVGPFDLMFNIQFGKALIAALCLIVFGQINYFFETVRETGPILLVLGLTGALGQVFIFVTIAKFGALTCAIIGLARKIVTLITSILIYGHTVTYVQAFGLALSISAMVMNFLDKGKKKKKGGASKGKGGGGGNKEKEPITAREAGGARGGRGTGAGPGAGGLVVVGGGGGGAGGGAADREKGAAVRGGEGAGRTVARRKRRRTCLNAGSFLLEAEEEGQRRQRSRAGLLQALLLPVELW
eukprot:CAMPEP_0194575480 /NCGR_PEP_ID=MMETSP0292-20121207/10950_1 /TAXON_ID=39354 /ORGANISM="Heterosigma akashiwo, Strain CCMP2393" /LENGTH=461 /DNA_ID=CAMNT_0039427281 /DNA_START=129 /DNA_END=1511 /DNA_ORIENTATION=+